MLRVCDLLRERQKSIDLLSFRREFGQNGIEKLNHNFGKPMKTAERKLLIIPLLSVR